MDSAIFTGEKWFKAPLPLSHSRPSRNPFTGKEVNLPKPKAVEITGAEDLAPFQTLVATKVPEGATLKYVSIAGMNSTPRGVIVYQVGETSERITF